MKQYIIDCFTDKVFSGNQAAVCIADKMPPDSLMRDIARENNFSETAFAVRQGSVYRLRWFTPGGEIDLCGHATLGTAFVLFNFYHKDMQEISFETLSGRLTVRRSGDGELCLMDFPAYEYTPTDVTDEMERAFGTRPREAYIARDLMAVFDSEDIIGNMKPDFEAAARLPGMGAAVTALGRDYDCVSRFFAPKVHIPEDPVTGSAHCMIAPYWGQRLGKDTVAAFQASERTGTLYCTLSGDRVIIGGRAVLFAVSDILPEQKFL